MISNADVLEVNSNGQEVYILGAEHSNDFWKNHYDLLDEYMGQTDTFAYEGISFGENQIGSEFSNDEIPEGFPHEIMSMAHENYNEIWGPDSKPIAGEVYASQRLGITGLCLYGLSKVLDLAEQKFYAGQNSQSPSENNESLLSRREFLGVSAGVTGLTGGFEALAVNLNDREPLPREISPYSVNYSDAREVMMVEGIEEITSRGDSVLYVTGDTHQTSVAHYLENDLSEDIKNKVWDEILPEGEKLLTKLEKLENEENDWEVYEIIDLDQ